MRDPRSGVTLAIAVTAGRKGANLGLEERAVTELHVVPQPPVRTGQRIAERRHLRTHLHPGLRWLQIDFDHAQVNAYWASPMLPRRWLRFEAKRCGLVAGPLTLLVRVPKFATPESERAHLVAVDDRNSP